MNEVYNFIKGLNIKSKYVVAAISGGPDSMLLLHILINLKKELNYNIVVAHVHHNIRKESDAEAENLKKICEKNNIIFEFMKIENYPNNKFSEMKAREIRYKFFDEVIKKYKSDILFTAHHGDDMIETILMRLTRGSSIKGYAGFEALSHSRGYIIARPLVFLTKDEIVKYLDEKNLWYAVDMSNKSDKYTRNRYRKYILPEIKKENANAHYKFLEFNKKMLMVDSYLKKEANNFLSNSKYIDINKFNELDEIIKIYVLHEYLKKIYKSDISCINDSHIYIIINILNKNKNTIFDLPINKKGVVEYNTFRVEEIKEIKKFNYTFTDEIKLDNGKSIKIDNSSTSTSNYVIHLNSKEIKFPLHVRNREDGDYMIVKNMTHKKKVKDILINSKIPSTLRDTIPIVTDDTGEIIWIPGIKKSHLDRKKDEKYDIILTYN